MITLGCTRLHYQSTKSGITFDNIKRREIFRLDYEQVIDQFAHSSALLRKRLKLLSLKQWRS